jgi:glucokinase
VASGFLIGVDLGGTKIHTALADREGQVLSEVRIPTEATKGPEWVIKRILDTINQTIQVAGINQGSVLGVAVGSPGPLSIKTGVVHSAPNLGWHEVPLRKLLEERLQKPVYIDNDANLAALGEHVYGAGRGVAHMVFITVSTGVGCGIILNGRVFHGVDGGAGELGHMKIMPDGPLCSCGSRGCLEALASGTAIARVARELVATGEGASILKHSGGNPGEITAITVTAAAAAGDEEAAGIVAEAARYLGIGISNVINIFNPELIVLGGGVMEIGQPLWQGVWKEVNSKALPSPRMQVRLVSAALGQRAGVLGAVAHCRHKALLFSHC